MNPQDRLFGEIAVRLKLLTRQQVAACLQDQAGERSHRKLGEVAVALGFLSDAQMQVALEHQRRILERRRGPAAAGGAAPAAAVRESKPKPRASSPRGGGAVEESVGSGAVRPRAPTPIETASNPLRAAAAQRAPQRAPAPEPTAPQPQVAAPRAAPAAPPKASPRANIGGGGGWTNAAPPSRPITGASLSPSTEAADHEPSRDAAPAAPADTAAKHRGATPDPDGAEVRALGSAATLIQQPLSRPAPAPEPAPEPASAPAPEPDAFELASDDDRPSLKGPTSGTQVGLGPSDLISADVPPLPDAPTPIETPSPVAKPPPPPPKAAKSPQAEPAHGDESQGTGTVVQTLKAPLERPHVATPAGQESYIVTLLRMAVQHRASDLHIHSGAEVLARIDGQLRPMSSGKPMSAKAARKVIAEFLTDEQWRALAIYGETDFAYEISGLARFRVNVYCQQRGFDIVFRVIPAQVPTLAQLGLPERLAQLTDYRTGLVLCTGPTGCGKTTTLASLINIVVQSKTDHVITVEDPVEFVYPEGLCVVNQREVRSHTESYSRALRAALREDPDIIVIAELRDLETISLAMSAAETGHLVLGTLHTASASQTINRLVSVFPAKEQAQVRTMLADSLRAVISQRLIPRAEAEGRVAALEVLMVNVAVANMVRDNKTAQLPSAMQTGKNAGMVTLDDSLMELAQQGVITMEDARRNATKKERFRG